MQLSAVHATFFAHDKVRLCPNNSSFLFAPKQTRTNEDENCFFQHFSGGSQLKNSSYNLKNKRNIPSVYPSIKGKIQTKTIVNL